MLTWLTPVLMCKAFSEENELERESNTHSTYTGPGMADCWLLSGVERGGAWEAVLYSMSGGAGGASLTGPGVSMSQVAAGLSSPLASQALLGDLGSSAPAGPGLTCGHFPLVSLRPAPWRGGMRRCFSSTSTGTTSVCPAPPATLGDPSSKWKVRVTPAGRLRSTDQRLCPWSSCSLRFPGFSPWIRKS